MAPTPQPFRNPFIPLDLHEKGGKTRRLKFDANAFADLEEATGLGIGQLMHREMSFALIRQFIVHGLRHEEPGLTVQRAGVLVQNYINKGGELEELALLINKAIMASGLFKAKAKDPDDGDEDEDGAEAVADPDPTQTPSESSGSDSAIG